MDIIKRPFTIIISGDIARPILPVVIKNPANGQELRTYPNQNFSLKSK